MTLAEKLGVAGFGLAVLGLIWQFLTWRLNYRIKLKVTVFLVQPANRAVRVVIEAVNLNRSLAVELRDVRLEWTAGKNLKIPPELWTHPARIEPLGRFQAALTLADLKANGWSLPADVRGTAITVNGKPFRSERTHLER